MTEQNTEIVTEFPRAIAKPAIRALAGAGITSFEQLTAHSARQLLALHGLGPKAIRILGEELASRGLAFADD